MKVAALAALSVLIVLPAEAEPGHRQNGSPVATCDNDGHCTTFAAAAPTSSPRRSRPKSQSTIATPAPATGTAAPATATRTAALPAATDATAAAAAATDATPAAATDTTAAAPA